MEDNTRYVPPRNLSIWSSWPRLYDEYKRLMSGDSIHTKLKSKSKYKKHIYSLNFQVK